MSFYEAEFLILGYSHWSCSSYEHILMLQFIFRTKNLWLSHHQKSLWAWFFTVSILWDYGFHGKIKQSFPFFYLLLFFPLSFLTKFIFTIANLYVLGCGFKKKNQQALVVYYNLEWNMPFPTNVLTCWPCVLWHTECWLSHVKTHRSDTLELIPVI